MKTRAAIQLEVNGPLVVDEVELPEPEMPPPAALTMPGVLFAGLLLGDLAVGASSAARALQLPSQLGAVVQGTLLLVTVGLLAVRRNRAVRSESPPDPLEPSAVEGGAPLEAVTP